MSRTARPWCACGAGGQRREQLDIFADSRDVMLRNDVLEALQRRVVVSARTAVKRLASEYPDDGALPAMSMLVRELDRRATERFADHGALAIARRQLEDEVIQPFAFVLKGPFKRQLRIKQRTSAIG
jgi:hypothetical protein